MKNFLQKLLKKFQAKGRKKIPLDELNEEDLDTFSQLISVRVDVLPDKKPIKKTTAAPRKKLSKETNNIPFERTFVVNVLGSSGNTYRVFFGRTGTNLTAKCSCRAGVSHYVCKHRINLLLGDITDAIDAESIDIQNLISMIDGSDVEKIFQDYASLHRRQSRLESIQALQVPAKRTTVTVDSLQTALADDGFALLHASPTIDIYDKTAIYQGSLKNARGVKAVEGITTTTIRNNGNYISMYLQAGSHLEKCFGLKTELEAAKKALQEAFND